MPRPPARLLRALAALAAVVVASCGGGGGGGSLLPTSPPPSAASTRDVPLTLTTANGSAAATVSLAYGVVALALGQVAADWVTVAAGAPLASSASACPGGGTQQISVADLDGSRALSAGDRVTVVLANCLLRPLDDAYSGSVTIDLQTFAAGAAPTWTGVLAFAPAFGVEIGVGASVVLQGSLQVAFTPSRLSKIVRVTSTTLPFTIVFSSGSTSGTDVLTRLDVSREIRRDTARTQSSFAFHLASDNLSGSVDVASTTPWGSWFDSYPDAGAQAVTGAAGSSAGLAAFTNLFNVTVNGSAAASVPADEATTGYPWSGTGWLPQDPAATGYTTGTASVSGFVPLLHPPASVAPNPGALEWLYSRPLAAGAVNSVTFVRSSSGAGQDWTPAQIAATLTVEGALVSATPASELEPGDTYLVLFDNTSVGVIASTSGATTPRPSATIAVAQTVTAIATAASPGLLLGAGASLALDAGASTAGGGAVTSTVWRQLSGPALVIAGATTAHATVSAADGTIGTAVVEVEVRNAAGDYDRQQLSIPVYGSLADVIVFAYRVDAAATTYAVAPPGGSTGYVHYLPTPNNVVDVYLGTPRFIGGLPGGTTWQAGVDVNYGPGGSPGVSAVFNSSFDVCTTPVGHFKVLDFAVDGTGAVTRLAIDVEDLCKTPSVTYGSIRYNSAVPIRP